MPAPAMQTMLLVGVLAAAVVFRVWLIAATDFPINDGALFFEFVKGVANTFPALPERVQYNGYLLPFSYPPLSFWVGALLTRLGFEVIGVVHVLPILMNIVYVLLIALLLLKSGRTRLFTALVLFFFCTRLRSFEWLVMGGGLSRGLGSIFLVAALLAVTVPAPSCKRELPHWRTVLGGAFVAGAILSHLEWGILAAASLVASRAFSAKTLHEFVTQTAIAGATAILLVAPWVYFIVTTHGVEPFLAAGGTSSWSLLASLIGLFELARPAIANPFILVGALALLIRRDLFWFAFVLICIFLTPRHAPTPLALPLSIFAAQGVLTVWGVVQRFVPRQSVAAAALGGAILAVATVNAYRQYRGTDGQFRPVPTELREAMAWVAEHHRGAKVAVFTTAQWYYDSSAEWFPSLAKARSTTTVQGREWLPNQAFERARTLGSDLKHSKSCTEAIDRLRPFGRSDLVWAETMKHCFTAPDFQPLYRNSRVTIYRAVPAPAGTAATASLKRGNTSVG